MVFCKTARWSRCDTTFYLFFFTFSTHILCCHRLKGRIKAFSQHLQPHARLRSHIQLPQKEKKNFANSSEQMKATRTSFSFRILVVLGLKLYMSVVPLIVVVTACVCYRRRDVRKIKGGNCTKCEVNKICGGNVHRATCYCVCISAKVAYGGMSFYVAPLLTTIHRRFESRIKKMKRRKKCEKRMPLYVCCLCEVFVCFVCAIHTFC